MSRDGDSDKGDPKILRTSFMAGPRVQIEEEIHLPPFSPNANPHLDLSVSAGEHREESAIAYQKHLHKGELFSKFTS